MKEEETSKKKTKLGKIEGEIYLWAPFVISVATLAIFLFWSHEPEILIGSILLFLFALTNARLLLFRLDDNK